MISPEILRRFTLFAGFNSTGHKDIAMISEEISLSADEWLFYENADADNLYLLVSGKVEVKIIINENLEEYADLATIVEGEVIGWSAVLEPHKYTMGVVALTDSKLIQINGQKLLDIMKKNPTIGLPIVTRIAQVLRERLDNLRVRFISVTV